MANKPTAHEPRRRARRRALQALYQWRLNPSPVSAIMAQFRRTQDFSNVDEDWFKMLVLGVAEHLDDLSKDLQPFSDRPFASLDVIEQIILAMGAWELRYATSLPVPVILDEAVDLTRRFGAEQAHGFINAVLDRAARAWRKAPGASAGAAEDHDI
ncbi:MAG: transcription antitermination factor NusB [Lysobacterales bacterium]